MKFVLFVLIFTNSANTTDAWASTIESDFAVRCRAPGVTRCWGFDDPSTDMILGSNIFSRDGGKGPIRHAFDTVTKLSGAGALRFDQLAGETGTDMSGRWQPDKEKLDSGYPAMGGYFSENSTFYVQFAYRIDDNMLINLPAWDHAPKIVNFFDSSFCGGLTTALSRVNIGYPTPSYGLYPALTAHSGCGTVGMRTALDGETWVEVTSPSFLYQQGDYACEYGVGPLKSCWQFPPNKWVTLYFKIHIGDWNAPNSSIEAWHSVDGQPYVKWMNVVKNFTRYSDEPNNPIYSNIMLSPQTTGWNTDIAPLTSHVWYDDLIISTQAIAEPRVATAPPPTGGGGTDAVAPIVTIMSPSDGAIVNR
jgi:hypothetical protein